MAIKSIDKYQVDECKFIYLLRNKNYVRQQSLEAHKIKLKYHVNWFKKFIQNKNNIIYLIIFKKQRVGYIRIEREKGKFLTSWALVKKFHGKGIVAKNLRKATVNKKFKYKAIIKKENIASIKVANKSGFKMSRVLKNKVYFTK